MNIRLFEWQVGVPKFGPSLFPFRFIVIELPDVVKFLPFRMRLER